MRELAGQVETPARSIGRCDGAPRPLGMLLLQGVTIQVDPLPDLASKPLEGHGIEGAGSIRGEAELGASTLRNRQKTLPHAEDTESPGGAYIM